MSDTTATTADDDRIELLVSSAITYADDGQVDVFLGLEEEALAEQVSFRMTEDDAWAMADVLRQAAEHLSRRAPQAFVRVRSARRGHMDQHGKSPDLARRR